MKKHIPKPLCKDARVEKVKPTNLGKNKFKKLLKAVVKENEDVLKRLADQ
jgi:hypothetical protein